MAKLKRPKNLRPTSNRICAVCGHLEEIKSGDTVHFLCSRPGGPEFSGDDVELRFQFVCDGFDYSSNELTSGDYVEKKVESIYEMKDFLSEGSSLAVKRRYASGSTSEIMFEVVDIHLMAHGDYQLELESVNPLPPPYNKQKIRVEKGVTIRIYKS